MHTTVGLKYRKHLKHVLEVDGFRFPAPKPYHDHLLVETDLLVHNSLTLVLVWRRRLVPTKMAFEF